jgi:isoquinoline 1-oxidoreductase
MKTNNRISESTSPRKRFSVKRRDFLKYLGGGLIIIFSPLKACRSAETPVAVTNELPEDFNAFLHIAEDGTVTCYTGKIEMGQGPIIALAQMMADELDVAFENVKMVMGDTDLCPWDGGTWGSTSIREFGPEMRKAAAKARQVLLEMASEKLEVPLAQLQVNNGIISDRNNNSRSVSYASLTKGKKIQKSVTGDVASIRANPHDDSTYVNLGTFQLQNANADAAERTFADALAVNPQSEAARTGLAQARAARDTRR